MKDKFGSSIWFPIGYIIIAAVPAVIVFGWMLLTVSHSTIMLAACVLGDAAFCLVIVLQLKYKETGNRDTWFVAIAITLGLVMIQLVVGLAYRLLAVPLFQIIITAIGASLVPLYLFCLLVCVLVIEAVTHKEGLTAGLLLEGGDIFFWWLGACCAGPAGALAAWLSSFSSNTYNSFPDLLPGGIVVFLAGLIIGHLVAMVACRAWGYMFWKMFRWTRSRMDKPVW